MIITTITAIPNMAPTAIPAYKRTCRSYIITESIEDLDLLITEYQDIIYKYLPARVVVFSPPSCCAKVLVET